MAAHLTRAFRVQFVSRSALPTEPYTSQIEEMPAYVAYLSIQNSS